MVQVEFEILASVPQVSRNQERRGKTDRIITFRAADGRVGFVTLPDENLTTQAIQKAVAEELRKQGLFTGQKLRADV